MLRFKVVLFLSLVFLTGVLYSQSFKIDRIQEIKFDGLVNSRPEELRDIINIKEGDKFDRGKINEALKKIYSLDIFKNAVVDVQESTNGVIVLFTVEENNFIRQVKFEKNRNINAEDLKKVIEFTDNSYFTESKLNKSLAAIQKKYVEEGYIYATVIYRLKLIDIKKRTFDLIFQLDEGKRVVVEKIVITGNKNVKADEIKASMKTKEQWFIFQSGVLKEENFREDKGKVAEVYLRKGYIDVEIKRCEWKIEELGGDKHKAIVVYIDLVEGEKYKTGKVTISGNTLFPTKDLMSYVTLKAGEVYDKTKMDKARVDIYNKYGDSGHLYANVSLVMNKDTSNRIVDSEFIITEGPRAHIENIIISGNTKTLTSVIKREIYFDEGELYIQRKVRSTYERLMQLQYFSEIKFLPLPGSVEGLIDIDLTVEEARTGLINFGVGYGTESGFNVSAQVSERNLFGTGRIISVGGNWGEKILGAYISFEEPWLFDTPLYAGISLSYNRIKYDNIPADSDGDGIIDGTNINYIENPSNSITGYKSQNYYFSERISLSGSLKRRFWIYWQASLGLGTTMYRNFDPNFSNPLIFTDHWETNYSLTESLGKGYTFKNNLSLGLNRNSTDHPLTPTYGSIFNLGFDYIGGMLGGDYHFTKAKTSFSIYWNPLWKIVFALYTSSEFLLSQFDGRKIYGYEDMPYYDGIFELRGWMGASRRGESKFYWSTEMRFQIYEQLWGVFFYDMGNLYGSSKEWNPFIPDGYMLSFGFGIQVNWPGLPIRIYAARRGYYDNQQNKFVLEGTQNLFDNIQPVLSIQGLF